MNMQRSEPHKRCTDTKKSALLKCQHNNISRQGYYLLHSSRNKVSGFIRPTHQAVPPVGNLSPWCQQQTRVGELLSSCVTNWVAVVTAAVLKAHCNAINVVARELYGKTAALTVSSMDYFLSAPYEKVAYFPGIYHRQNSKMCIRVTLKYILLCKIKTNQNYH